MYLDYSVTDLSGPYRRLANEELKLTATPSSLVESFTVGAAA
jgi:hypothetical protein